MVEDEVPRDLAGLAVALLGSLEETGDPWLPFRLVDSDGAVVEAVSAFFCDLLAGGRAESTVRSYGMDLLRWFRFLWAVEVPWNQATRLEARDCPPSGSTRAGMMTSAPHLRGWSAVGFDLAGRGDVGPAPVGWSGCSRCPRHTRAVGPAPAGMVRTCGSTN